jgi:hypothetical protein
LTVYSLSNQQLSSLAKNDDSGCTINNSWSSILLYENNKARMETSTPTTSQALPDSLSEMVSASASFHEEPKLESPKRLFGMRKRNTMMPNKEEPVQGSKHHFRAIPVIT